MKTSGTTLSASIRTEQAVRDAYQQTAPGRRFLTRWKAATWPHKVLMITALCSIAIILSFSAASVIDPNLAGVLVGAAAALFATGAVEAERKLFREHFEAYGSMLNEKPGEPSNLRYLYFIDVLRLDVRIKPSHITHLIPAIEAQRQYRDHFLRAYPVLTILSAIIAMLVASGIAQPVVWQSLLGWQLLTYTVVAWVIFYYFGRKWRSLRPGREARERELLNFLHKAVHDLKEDQSSFLDAAERETVDGGE